MKKGIKKKFFNFTNLNELVNTRLRLKKLAIANKKKITGRIFDCLTPRYSPTEMKQSINSFASRKNNWFKKNTKKTFVKPSKIVESS